MSPARDDVPTPNPGRRPRRAPRDAGPKKTERSDAEPVAERALVADSRFLAYLLRHNPPAAGLSLDEAGWIDVDALLDALARHGRPLTFERLRLLVEGRVKRRFEFNDGRIRAAQGHSLPVDLALPPAVPPPELFHGTVDRFLPAILERGLLPMGRTHVHLSADSGTAVDVAARRGTPVVLRVDAAAMATAGHIFHRATNGVWLTSHVPGGYLNHDT